MTPEHYNMDVSQRVVVTPKDYGWIASPSATVTRMPLERAAAESGHTTSLVTYAAGASFARHSHPGGEEIFVLDGIFEDESGSYPAGTYLRNPIGTSHRPSSTTGCTLFVKLAQHALEDQQHLVIDTRSAAFVPGYGVFVCYHCIRMAVFRPHWSGGPPLSASSLTPTSVVKKFLCSPAPSKTSTAPTLLELGYAVRTCRHTTPGSTKTP